MSFLANRTLTWSVFWFLPANFLVNPFLPNGSSSVSVCTTCLFTVGLWGEVLWYLYMHVGYYLTMLVRFPLILLLLYLAHSHLVHPGDFLLTGPMGLSWKHLLTLWAATNFSFVFRAKDYPFKWGTLHWMPGSDGAAPSPDPQTNKMNGKVISLQRRRAV